MDVARAEELRAVQGDERAPVQSAHGRERAVRVQILHDAVELLVEVRRGHAVEQVADVIVAGNAGQAEQGVGVGARARLAQRALVRQERRGLHEEHRQPRHGDVGHRVSAITSAAPVRQLLEARPQPLEMALEAPHRCASTAMIAASTARRSAAGMAR